MKLNHLKGSGMTSEYLCEITEELDKASGLGRKEECWCLYHYIIIDDYSIKEKCLSIRVHGGTVGALYFDDNKLITKIDIDTNYVVKTYEKDVNERMQRFIGIRLEW